VPIEPPIPNEVIYSPLTTQQIVERLDDQGFITGLVVIDLSSVIDGDLESFLDDLSERLVGSSLGMEIDYTPHSILTDGSIVMSVTLNPSMVLDIG
jgi:hypothetical protein